MTELKKLKHSIIMFIMILLSFVLLGFFYFTIKIDRLHNRIHQLSDTVATELPEQLNLMENYLSKFPQPLEPPLSLIPNDIHNLNRVQLNQILVDSQEMKKFQGYYNAYQKNLADSWDKLDRYFTHSKQIEDNQAWIQFEQKSKDIFFTIDAMSLLIFNFNTAINNGGDLFVNILFLDMEKFPELNIQYFPNISLPAQSLDERS